MNTWRCILVAGMTAIPPSAATEQDLCSTATAAVTVGELAVEESFVDAKGSWQAGGGASGVMLEYRIDQDRFESETWLGAAGAWSVVRMKAKDQRCGRHTLRVYAYPSVQDGGRQLHCLGRATSAARQFEISCAPIAEIVDCQWECSGGQVPHCNGICTATASRGKLSYVPFWGTDGEEWQQGTEATAAGPWNQVVACSPGQRISFKVRDRDGRGLWSNVDEIGCGVTE